MCPLRACRPLKETVPALGPGPFSRIGRTFGPRTSPRGTRGSDGRRPLIKGVGGLSISGASRMSPAQKKRSRPFGPGPFSWHIGRTFSPRTLPRGTHGSDGRRPLSKGVGGIVNIRRFAHVARSKETVPTIGAGTVSWVSGGRLVLELRREELAVQTGDMRDGDLLGALGLAGTRVGAVPNPSSSILATIALARRAPSTRPWGSLASDDTRAATKSIAEPFLQVAAQAPQPMQAAASIASSASAFGMRMAFASGTEFVRTEMKPPACRNLVVGRAVHHEVLITGRLPNATARW